MLLIVSLSVQAENKKSKKLRAAWQLCKIAGGAVSLYKFHEQAFTVFKESFLRWRHNNYPTTFMMGDRSYDRPPAMIEEQKKVDKNLLQFYSLTMFPSPLLIVDGLYNLYAIATEKDDNQIDDE